ncbi:T9SS type A sorting domain-containing protein [Hymenobacter cheonanensis]|uniref:T9SS type A sorting domain-containing protein n=1 Tax=Hymenobacter sp. CA2-7 TaxID=3063993 RepID=UPI0027134E61|nr:T9SS type A sorting domain-containing protein [Hymenobacter sp. CA2-7]MDO7884160.1 T9SS type A sorting domain-containing protein [Hymenobacter sp. CA2-7]
MKKLFTLAAAGSLAVASLSAQAQVTVDGQLTAAEVSTANYTLVGRYTGTHGFAPSATNSAGVLALYAAADANNIYFFLVATLQNDGSPATISNSLQLLVARPGVTGVPVGTALPKPTASTTSFQGFAPYLELPGDMGIGIKGNGTAAQYQVDGVVYAGGTTPTATAAVLSGTTGVAATGATASITGQTGSLTVFNGAQVAYRTATSLNTNPGYGTNGAGAVPAYGLEVALSRASLGLPTAGGAVQVFALQNNGGGDYVSSDFIPQNTAALPASFTAAPNLGANPDFRLVPGTQAATVNVGATTGVTLANRASAAELALGVYPNPVRGASTVTYKVADRASNVNIVLTDLLGRTVRTVENGLKPVGTQTAPVDADALAAGTYLMRVQVGDKVSTSKVSVL